MSTVLLTVAAGYWLTVAVFAGHLLATHLLESRPSFSAFKAWCFAWPGALLWPVIILALLAMLAWRKGLPR